MVLTGLLVAFCVSMAVASAAHAADIISSGPLTDIGVGPDLSCSVNYAGDDDGEFYGGDACGTFLDVGGPVASGGTVYGANDLPAEESVDSTPFTQDAQTPISGDGSAGSPFTVATQVDAGSTGLSLTQTDSYVSGADEYTSRVLITNSGSQAQTVVLYHAADCYLGNADVGYGYQDNASGGVFCTKNADNSPAGRVEGFIPIDGGSNYLETFFNSNWSAVGTGQPLPDTCDCSTYEDNGMGISWTVTVPAGGGVTRSWDTDFSPVGTIQASSYVALGDSVAAGEGIGYGWSWTGNTWSGGTGSGWDTTSGQSNPDCHQTQEGYPHVLAGLLSAQLLDLACTGASTSDGILGPEAGLSGSQLGTVGEPNSAYDNASPDVVSLTVGADDVDFSDKVIACYTPLQHACGTDGDEPTLNGELATMRTGLTDVLNDIEQRGEADGKIPVVVITEYYSPFPNTYPTHSSCIDISPNRRLGVTLTDSEMQYLEHSLLDLNGSIDDVAALFPNVVIVPAPLSFAQHRWCSSDPWVFGPSIDSPSIGHPLGNGNPSPFHPTSEGQNAIAQNIANYLSDTRHVDVGSAVPLDFGDISVLFNDVETAGTAFFSGLGATPETAAVRAQVEGSRRVMTASSQRAVTANDATSAADGAGLPPATDFDPVQLYSAGTSAQYTSGMTVTLPSLGASALYEDINGAWQLIPTTTDGTNLTATLSTLAPLALGNPAPEVSAAFTTTGDGGQAPATVAFDASGSTVASGAIASDSWDFGDGATGTGVTPSHVYAAAGTYTVTLTATSDAGASDVTTHTVTVTDAAPVANVTDPASAVAGVAVGGFDASRSSTADGTAPDVYWDFGDGSDVVDAPATTHTFATAGTYTVTTTVMDDEGTTATQTAVVTVTNPQTPTATPPSTTGSSPSAGGAHAKTRRRAKVSFAKRITVKGKHLQLKVSCAKAGLACAGKVKLVIRHGRKTVAVASGHFRLKAGKHVTMKLSPTKAAKKLLASTASIAARVSKTKGTVFTLTLTAHKRTTHHRD